MRHVNLRRRWLKSLWRSTNVSTKRRHYYRYFRANIPVNRECAPRTFLSAASILRSFTLGCSDYRQNLQPIIALLLVVI